MRKWEAAGGREDVSKGDSLHLQSSFMRSEARKNLNIYNKRGSLFHSHVDFMSQQNIVLSSVRPSSDRLFQKNREKVQI